MTMSILICFILIFGISSNLILVNLASLFTSVILIGMLLLLHFHVTFNVALLYLIYVGAILILFVFLFLTLDTTTHYNYNSVYLFIPSLVLLFFDINYLYFDTTPLLTNIGTYLFNDFFAIHTVSILLFITLVGTISLLL